MTWCRVTVIVEVEEVHACGSERVEIELPTNLETLADKLPRAWLIAFAALKREMARRDFQAPEALSRDQQVKE